MFHQCGGFTYGNACGLCHNDKLTGNDGLRFKTPRVNMRRRDSHKVSRFIHVYFDVGGTGFILNATVRVITKDCHCIPCTVKIRKTFGVVVTIGVEVLFKLIVRHQHREQRHHYCGTVSA